jgi:predicted PurR-regulated permease PerM
MSKKLATATAVAMTVLVCALALWHMRGAVQLLTLSLAVSSGLNPLIDWMTGRGLARRHAIGASFLIAISTIVAGFLLFASYALDDLALLLDHGPTWYDQTRQSLIKGAGGFAQIASVLPTSTALVNRLVNGDTALVGMVVTNTLTWVMLVVLLLISALSLGFYWLADQQRIERLWLSLLPLRARSTIRSIWTKVYLEMGCYIRSELILAGLTVILLFGVYQVVQLPGASLLAIGGGLAQVVPIIGIPLAIIPAVIVGAVSGPYHALLALAGGSIVLAATRGVVAPRLLRNHVGVNPVLMIVLMMSLAELAGVWSIVFATPLAAAIQVAVGAARSGQGSVVQPQFQAASDFQQRLDRIETRIREQQASPPRLNDLLGRARKLVMATVSMQRES